MGTDKRYIPRGRKMRSGRYVLRGGRLVRVTEPLAARAKDDAHDIVSKNLGCPPHQRADFERRFGHLGVKFVQDNDYHCSAILPDRSARLKLLKARGMHCFDEIRG